MTAGPLLYRYDYAQADRWLLLDRDGTLNRDPGYVHAVRDLALLPGVLGALLALRDAGWGFAIASNQAGLAKGRFTVGQMETFNDALISLLAAHGLVVSGLAVCPHHPHGSVSVWTGPCPCRKPEPGLLLALSAQHGFSAHDAVFVGDKAVDREAAERAGFRFSWGRDENDWANLLLSTKGPRR